MDGTRVDAFTARARRAATRLLLAAGGLLSVAALAGCAGEDEASAAPPPPNEVTRVLWERRECLAAVPTVLARLEPVVGLGDYDVL